MSADPKLPDGDLRITMTLDGVTVVRIVPRVELLRTPDVAVAQATFSVWRQVSTGLPPTN